MPGQTYITARLYNAVYASMMWYGLAELLMRTKMAIIFQDRVELPDASQIFGQGEEKFSRAFREALQEAYARLKLRRIGVKDSKYQTFMELIHPEQWDKDVTLYMKFGLLEGKGPKSFDAPAKDEQVKVRGCELLLAILGRIYYSVVERVRDGRIAYLAFTPSYKPDLELALHVRGLVTRFEADIPERIMFMRRFSDVPDIAKPLVLSLFLDQNVLTLAWRKFKLNPLSLSWIVLEGGKNFRENVLIPLDESMNVVIALGEYQKPVRNLVQSIIEYGPRGGGLPRESIEWLSRIAYAFMNRDPEELAGVNLEVLRARDEEGGGGLWPLRQKELLRVCEIIEGM
jgi:hypothetical protein